MACPNCGSRAISYTKGGGAGESGTYACRAAGGSMCPARIMDKGSLSKEAEYWRSGITTWVSSEAAQEMLAGSGRYQVGTTQAIPEGPCASLLLKIIAWKDGQVGFLHDLIEEARKVVSNKYKEPRNAYGRTEEEQKAYDALYTGQYNPLTPGIGGATIGPSAQKAPAAMTKDELVKYFENIARKKKK